MATSGLSALTGNRVWPRPPTLPSSPHDGGSSKRKSGFPPVRSSPRLVLHLSGENKWVFRPPPKQTKSGVGVDTQKQEVLRALLLLLPLRWKEVLIHLVLLTRRAGLTPPGP